MSAVQTPLPGAKDWAGVDEDDARAVLTRAFELYQPRLAIASSFSMEDVVLLDIALSIDSSARVFSLDTGRLPEETYACAEAIRARYGVEIEWQFPDRSAVEAIERASGLYSFRESLEARHACCHARKVAPLRRVLSELDAWVTGQRRSQSITRTRLEVVEPAGDGPIKINPLASWSYERVVSTVKDHALPYNRLYDQGYASIGCAPCTRAIAPGEDERAGRWWWEQPEHKECGLHGRPGFESLEEPS